MTTNIICPYCNSNNCKKNGYTKHEKQNHYCHNCKRQFVFNREDIIISEETKGLVDRLLLERISLAGICRVVNVSMSWLLRYIKNKFDDLPDNLNVESIPEELKNKEDEEEGSDSKKIEIDFLGISEADELWSFVGNKGNKKWVWLAIDVATRQVISFVIGKRNNNCAQELWDNIPEEFKENLVYTDFYNSYNSAIPKSKHRSVGKETGKTNHIERLNCTFRHRISRLVRKSLAFSKKIENHIGAIKYFICNYNKESYKSFVEKLLDCSVNSMLACS